MRNLILLSGVAFALSAGAASAQFVDPRTAAGAAGEISGQVAPGVETPSQIDRSRDPALGTRQTPGIAPAEPGAALPAEPGARTTPVPPPAAGGPPRATTDSPTSAVVEQEAAHDGRPAGAAAPARPNASPAVPTDRRPAP